jgi:glycerate dehydrogenase
MSPILPRVVFLNAKRLGPGLSWLRLHDVCDLELFDDTSTDPKHHKAFLQKVEGANAIISKSLHLDAELVALLPPSVKLIQEAGVDAYNNISLAEATAKKIAVMDLPHEAAAKIAHNIAALTIAQVLALSTSLVAHQHEVRTQDGSTHGDNRTFEAQSLLDFPHFEVQGKTLGLMGSGTCGLGTIGTRVAMIADALGMNVVVSSRAVGFPTSLHPNVSLKTCDELLATSDFVSVNVPMSSTAKHMISHREFEIMKKSAYLISVCRGAAVDEEALSQALREGSIAGAALDVYEEEPLPTDSSLRDFGPEQVILTPHIGWQPLEARQRMVDSIADSIRSFFAPGGGSASHHLRRSVGEE